MNAFSETYELCLLLCGLNPNSDEDFNDESKVDEILYDKYGIEDTAGLDELIRDLAKLIDIGVSPFTGKRYKGFSKGEEWVYKIEC